MKRNSQYNSHDNVCDVLSDIQLPMFTYTPQTNDKDLKMLSLFSGCGGMDIGFEGGFICHKKSVDPRKRWIANVINHNWVQLKKTKFVTVFANDILNEARIAWLGYMKRRGYNEDIYHYQSIVDLVKLHKQGVNIFPRDVDIVTGGFPCQDFSVAGKRKGLESTKNHKGKLRLNIEPTEENRGRLYFWMKQVIDIVKPKIFIAENVKGLVNLGEVQDIIQKDFSSADDNGYIVLPPKVLHAADYGVPESRERVIFIGIRKSELTEKAYIALMQDEIPSEYDPYPIPTHNFSSNNHTLMPIVVCQDIFEELKEPHETNDLSQANLSRAKYMGAHCQGQKEIKLDQIGPTIRSEHHGNIEFRRLSKEHGGCMIDELELGMEERRLTPRECALIQTFPPDYPFVRYKDYSKKKFALSASGAYKVIGNAVPPILAYNIAMRLQEVWSLYFKK